MSLLPGLHFDKPHGQQGIFDQNQTLVQDRIPRKYKFMDGCGYLHATHLHRSSKDINVIKRDFKFKHEWGKTFPVDFEYPVSFYLPHGMNVPTVWKQAGLSYWLNSFGRLPKTITSQNFSIRLQVIENNFSTTVLTSAISKAEGQNHFFTVFI